MGHRGLRIYARSNDGVETTEDQARDYRAAFFRAYPGLGRWHDRVRVAPRWGLGGERSAASGGYPGRPMTFSPHSVLPVPAQRPARSSSPSEVARVQGRQPMLG